MSVVPHRSLSHPTPTPYTTPQLQSHHNGYIPGMMLRTKLLHQYLAQLAGFKSDHHDDINVTSPVGQTGPAGPAAGSAAAGRRRRLRFEFEKDEGGEAIGVTTRRFDDDVTITPQVEIARQRRQSQQAQEQPLSSTAAGGGDGGEGDGEGGAAADADAADGDREQQQQQGSDEASWSRLEQHLGGRLLAVHDVWLNMPLALALQVGCM